MASVSQFFHKRGASVPEPSRPQLDLSGPMLTRAFETLVAGTEEQGGIERWIDALKLKSQMISQAMENLAREEGTGGLPLETFKSLCAFMASVRRRVGPFLEEDSYSEVSLGLRNLIDGAQDVSTANERISEFCARFPQDRKHRWVRDLAVEILHGMDPERYPLMCRWVWDAKANTGVIREIWFDDDVDNLTLAVPDGYETFQVLREELSQFLTSNGVFRDVVWYVDLLCAKVYADYIAAQGGIYLRADFSAPGDPMEHTKRLLGLDGVHSRSGRSRLKAISGESFLIEDGNLLTDGNDN